MPAEAAFWNGLAERYSKQPVGDPDAFEKKIAITKARMNPRDVVLDIGCGTGSLALKLASSAAEVHGLDISEEMLRIARGKAEKQGADNVTFHCGPFDESFDAFGPASLDGICAYSILHLVEDREAALAHVFEMLKPGGFFISSTVVLGESWVPYRPILWVMRKLGKAPMVKIISKEQLAEEMGRAGFVDIAEPDVGASNSVGFMTAKKPA